MRITIDRSQSMPLYLQIKGQIAYQIGMGVLKSGEQLPTIRKLAEDIGVAPLTVVQSIEALAADGLIETRPGVGSFVVELHADALAQSRSGMIDGLVDEHLQDVLQRGISMEEYATNVWARVYPEVRPELAKHAAIFVGNYPVDTKLFSDLLADEFRPFGFEIVGRTIKELSAPTPETSSLLAIADLIIAVPLRFGETRKLVGSSLEVVGLPLTLSPTTREHLAQIAPQSRVGMVVTEALFVQSMRNIVSIYYPLAEFAPVAVIDDRHAVSSLVSNVDVVIYSMGIRDRIHDVMPRNVIAIELTHMPDPMALAELREEIGDFAERKQESSVMMT